MRLVRAGRTVSYAGDAVALVALTMRVSADDNPGAVTALLLAFAVLAVLMIPVAGRIVDRYDSRRPEPGEHEESGGMLEGFRVVFTDGLLRVLVPGWWVFIIAAEVSRTRATPAAFAVIGLASAAMGEARNVVRLFVSGVAGGRWHGGRVAQRGGRRVVDDPDGGRRPGPGAGGADRERSRVQHRGAGARRARRQRTGSAYDVRGDRRLVRAGRGGARRRAAKPPATRRTGCLTRGKGFGPSGAHALALVPMSEQQSPQTATDDGQADLPEQIRVRRDKRDRLLAEGVQPYPVTVPRSHTLAEIRKTYDTQELEPDTKTGETVSVTGRVIFLRNTGKLCFVRLREGDGTELQVMLSLADVGEASLAEFKSAVDLGDLLAVTGEVVTSRRGELSVQATSWGLAAKTLRPLPNEHNPLSEETRARLRYVDLIVRPEARGMVRTKAAVLKSLRATLDGQGYTEVETPVLQLTNGGAAARPFRTHLNAFDQPMLLRIALELDLKRAMIGGVDRVYEIGRTFRNEGLDSTHAAEFSMLEAYQAYGDYNTMAELARTLVLDAARAVGRTVVPARDGSEIDLEEEWRRLPVLEAVSTAVGEEITTSTSAEELIKIAAAHDVELVPSWGYGEIVLELFEKLVEHTLMQPTYVIDYPASVRPLAKPHREIEGLVEAFDLIINGVELAPAYSELNDPVIQRERLVEQSLLAAAGDPEAMELDEDFLRAMEYGMPPAGGIGMGVDRLVMLLTGKGIRETILFPLLRPE